MRLLFSSLFSAGVLAAALVACSSDDTLRAAPSAGVASGDALEDGQAVVDNYAANVYQSYADSLDGAKKLKVAIDAFVAMPTAETQQAAKDAWSASRKPYVQTEGYRFYGGPIDGPEGDINAWPLDESFIDYTKDDPDAGLVNDLSFAITKESIAKKNTEGGEANVSDGYHAVELLLWGQDTDDPALKTQGHRSFTDYTTARNAERRKAYLSAVTDLLVDDLQRVTDAWAPDAENYRKTFRANPKAALTKVLTGIGSLAGAELSGQRMTVAYEDRSQEDEHSCFSDTTNADLQGNFLGIQNVYLGTYGSNTKGAGLAALVAAVDPALDAKVKTDLQTTAAAFQAMQAQPFDFSIQQDDRAPERQHIREAIQGVKTLADDIPRVAAKLGVPLNVPPEGQ